MDRIYYLGNASLTLRLVRHLHQNTLLPPSILAVVHRIDGWVVKVCFQYPPALETEKNFHAFACELGIVYEPDIRLQMVFWSLETGQSLVEVMRRYQVAIVSYGAPEREEIEAFCEQFTQGLGYCPETLA